MSYELYNGFVPKNSMKSSPITSLCCFAASSLETNLKSLANFAAFISASNAVKVLSTASFLKKTVITISSLKLSDNRFELMMKSPSIPSRNNTKNTLNTTET